LRVIDQSSLVVVDLDLACWFIFNAAGCIIARIELSNSITTEEPLKTRVDDLVFELMPKEDYFKGTLRLKIIYMVSDKFFNLFFVQIKQILLFLWSFWRYNNGDLNLCSIRNIILIIIEIKSGKILLSFIMFVLKK
jgi:hypothetical protein